MILGSSIFLARAVFRIFYGFTVIGTEKIPADGKLIVACNHLSNADPPALGVAVSGVRRVAILAKRELFKLPFAGWYLGKLGCIRLDRHRKGGDLSAIRRALEVLDDGGCLMMFPEGTRSKNALQGAPKSGIGLLAHKSGAPVLAARISGSEKFPRRTRIKIVFGNIRRFDETALNGREPAPAYQEFANEVMSDIMSITEDEKRAETSAVCSG